MGVRTLEEFADALDADLAWRKRELATWGELLLRSREHQQEVLLRGAWALLYAHWEGYVKNACTLYLEHVSRRGLTVGQLIDPLAAVAMRAAIASAAQSSHGSVHTQLVTAIRGEKLKACLPYDSATIKTFSNLKFEVFEDVLLSVGCDPSVHAVLRDEIDRLLLKNRNDIAHGKYLAVDASTWETLRSNVLDVLDDVKAQLANAAVRRAYERRTAPNP